MHCRRSPCSGRRTESSPANSSPCCLAHDILLVWIGDRAEIAVDRRDKLCIVGRGRHDHVAPSVDERMVPHAVRECGTAPVCRGEIRVRIVLGLSVALNECIEHGRRIRRVGSPENALVVEERAIDGCDGIGFIHDTKRSFVVNCAVAVEDAVRRVALLRRAARVTIRIVARHEAS